MRRDASCCGGLPEAEPGSERGRSTYRSPERKSVAKLTKRRSPSGRSCDCATSSGAQSQACTRSCLSQSCCSRANKTPRTYARDRRFLPLSAAPIHRRLLRSPHRAQFRNRQLEPQAPARCASAPLSRCRSICWWPLRVAVQATAAHKECRPPPRRPKRLVWIYDAHGFVGIGTFKAEMFRTPREMKNETTILCQKPTFLLLPESHSPTAVSSSVLAIL
jgi:hypothetical protein